MALRGSRPAPRAVAEEVLAMPAGSAARAYLETRREVMAWVRILETRQAYERLRAEGWTDPEAKHSLAMRLACDIRTIRNRLEYTRSA